jgi:hypothetical protein
MQQVALLGLRRGVWEARLLIFGMTPQYLNMLDVSPEFHQQKL